MAFFSQFSVEAIEAGPKTDPARSGALGRPTGGPDGFGFAREESWRKGRSTRRRRPCRTQISGQTAAFKALKTRFSKSSNGLSQGPFHREAAI
jgi:hypothetical protein